jgi:hypothetical protein
MQERQTSPEGEVNNRKVMIFLLVSTIFFGLFDEVIEYQQSSAEL